MQRGVVIGAGSAELEGGLSGPENARGVVLFAHGSGSSRHSPRNKFVARVLQQAGMATLLVDLLTVAEEQEDARTRALRFDIDLLAERLTAAIDWLGQDEWTAELKVGLFGASTGAGAALVAAAARPEQVGAVVSRGGRPDLANGALGEVRAPTLLVVGSLDEVVMGLNQQAERQLHCECEIRVVPGAGHLFEEPGALEEVARLTRNWFVEHLGRPLVAPQGAAEFG